LCDHYRTALIQAPEVILNYLNTTSFMNRITITFIAVSFSFLLTAYDRQKQNKTTAFATTTPTRDDKINIPDAKFKSSLITAKVDKNNDGAIQKSEALLVTVINVYNSGIKSLEGIQFFENLVDLNCASNSLTFLDVSKNIKLKDLFCKENKLIALDISKNSLLESVTCSGNQLTELNAEGLKFMETIECAANQLTKLNVTGLTSLGWLDCRWNNLTGLDITGCKYLKTLKCENNLISKILYSSEVDELEKKWTKDESATLFPSISKNQNQIFFDQIKAMVVQGETKQFSEFKGQFLRVDGAGQKTYECSFKLDGFNTTVFEKDGKLEFMASSDSYSAVHNNVEFLTNESVRDMGGLPGYKNYPRPAEEYAYMIALMKPGSDLKLVIFKLKDNKGYTLLTSTFKSAK
jgi:hypothetical protein